MKTKPKAFDCGPSLLKTSLKWLTVAMPLLERSKRQERDKTRERLERYGAMKDGLT